MKDIERKIERVIIYTLISMMAGILILATIELGYYLVKNIIESDYLLIDLDNLMDLFGVFLLVLIGIELLDTIKVYLQRNVVHVEVVVLVAIIAIARKVVVLKFEEFSGIVIIGLGVLVAALAVTYYLIKKAGMLECNFDKADEDEENREPESDCGKRAGKKNNLL
ncbi:MAG: phosphate-starvation-inducible PsiE family protein [Bacteroidales bacterium]|nr:phosphate-starvation-inducible PsiE family protein [Bacteroidales bacterium]